AWLLFPTFNFRSGDRRGICRVRVAADMETDRLTSSRQDFVRRDQRAYALVVEQTPDKADRYWTVGLRKRSPNLDVHPAAGDQKNPGGIDAQNRHLGAVVGVLNQPRRLLAFQQSAQEHRECGTKGPRLQTC